jgi:2-polyprenyl-3-methyl-5-hydroxy-6-metoxy-1,4-benzoquinol methylase
VSGLYESKPDGYFNKCRFDLLELLPQGKSKILEIGAGGGDTLLQAKQQGLAETVVGIELVPIAGSNQSHPALDRFIIGDIEKLTLDFAEESFDVILCGDVLEHLNDPWNRVKELSRYLKPNGLFIASIPNVREFKTLFDVVVNGDFHYSAAGIMDRTHLRFFCKKNMCDLFEQHDLRIIAITSDLDRVKRGKRALFDRLTAKLFHDFLVTQFYITAEKSPGSRQGKAGAP